MKRNEYICDATVVRLANAAIRIELEKKKAMNIPAVIYDSETQQIFHVDSNGNRIATTQRLRKGRYSERIGEKA